MEREGGLNETQKLWFRKVKPVEELYDTEEDPFEVKNLADLPEFRSKLEELRAVQESWVKETGDPGLMSEPELVRRMWPPDGVQPETEPPSFSYQSNTFNEETEVTLDCATEGASIA